MAPWVRTALGRTLVNSAAIFGGEAVSRLATLEMAVLVARQFGPVALGQYAYTLRLASVLLIIPDFGLNLLATRELAAESEQPKRIFWSLHWIEFFMTRIFVGLPKHQELFHIPDEAS
jgi:O-antigen/teichoic acid export membrane protein